MGLRQLARLGPAALGELVAGAVPDADGQRLGDADLLDQRVASLGPQCVQRPVDDPGRIPKLLGTALPIADRLLEPGGALRGVAERRSGDGDPSHWNLLGLARCDRPRSAAAAPLRPRGVELLHHQDPLGVVLADEIAPLRQTDPAGQLKLDEAGPGYRVPGRDQRVRVSATRFMVASRRCCRPWRAARRPTASPAPSGSGSGRGARSAAATARA